MLILINSTQSEGDEKLMWIESPKTGEMINFAEVYKIRTYEYISSSEKTLRIEIYFFSKDVPTGDGYYSTQEHKEDFFSGDLDTGLQVKEWLEKKLDIAKFEAVETPPVEVVISEGTLKNVVEGCLDKIREVESLLPEGVFLNPTLLAILDDPKTVDYLIERGRARYLTQVHQSWELDFELTKEISHSLEILIKSLKVLDTVFKASPKLAKDQEEALRSILGDPDEKEG